MEKTGYINDFIKIDTKIFNQNEILESTTLCGLEDLFRNHLSNSEDKGNHLNEYHINVFNIKIGDLVKLQPSEWANNFSEEKGVPLGKEYGNQFEVVDINIQFITKNPRQRDGVPSIEILLYLKEIEV